jgi:hypothetical protein
MWIGRNRKARDETLTNRLGGTSDDQPNEVDIMFRLREKTPGRLN